MVVEGDTEQPSTSKGSRGKRQSKLERLRAQGSWVSVAIGDGQTVPYFAMPTPKLQSEWNETLESWLKKDLKAKGFELIHATRREHPFHSEILRQRIDALAEHYVVVDDGPGSYISFEPEYKTAEGVEAMRREWHKYVEENQQQYPLGNLQRLTARDAEEMTERGLKKFRKLWAAAFGKYRDMLRDPVFWRGTNMHKVVFPSDGPKLPDGPPPKPVFVKPNRDLVLALRGGAVDLWIRCGL